MSWKKQLIDVIFFNGLGSVLAKALPEHWQRRANERLNDFNPYSVIAGNHDLLRAARLAWVQAALEVLDVVRKSAQSGGQAFDDKNTVVRFEAQPCVARRLVEQRRQVLPLCCPLSPRSDLP